MYVGSRPPCWYCANRGWASLTHETFLPQWRMLLFSFLLTYSTYPNLHSIVCELTGQCYPNLLPVAGGGDTNPHAMYYGNVFFSYIQNPLPRAFGIYGFTFQLPFQLPFKNGYAPSILKSVTRFSYQFIQLWYQIANYAVTRIILFFYILGYFPLIDVTMRVVSIRGKYLLRWNNVWS